MAAKCQIQSKTEHRTAPRKALFTNLQWCSMIRIEGSLGDMASASEARTMHTRGMLPDRNTKHESEKKRPEKEASKGNNHRT
jgi:hypothetical protein